MTGCLACFMKEEEGEGTMRYSIGIDIGGTKIASGIVNEDGHVIQQVKVPSIPTDREKMFNQVVLCVRRLLDHSSIPLKQMSGIGVGVPGKVDVLDGVAVFQNNIPWANFPLRQRLRDVFSVERMTIDNDVYMATYAEWKRTNLAFDDLFTYMTISTGISCAMIQKGEFLRGAGFAGELGLVPVSQLKEETVVQQTARTDDAEESRSTASQNAAVADEVCHPHVERLESIAAGPALEKAASVSYNRSDMTAEHLFMEYYSGERRAASIVHQIAAALAQGVYSLVSIIDPHKIVVGGSVATENPKLIELVKEKLTLLLLEEQNHIVNNIEVSTMESSQGIIGAGLRVLDVNDSV